MDVDVLVVGGGPAGTYSAHGLASRGHDVLVVEEHPNIGRPVQCAGLFTPRVLEMAPFDVEPLVRNTVSGALVHSPNGTCVDLDAGRPMAHATDRAAFDQLMGEAAAKAGAEVRTSTRCTDIEPRPDGRGVVASLERHDGQGDVEESWDVEARLVVGADGVQGRVARWFGLHRPKQLISLYGVQASGVHVDDPSKVVIWVGEDVSPGFFAYIVPTGGDTGKIEVGVWNADRPARHYYEQLLRHPLARHHFGDLDVSFTISATIPLGPTRKSVGDRVMLVGDAAGQAKPASGGGVYTAMTCADHLVRVADEGLRADALGASDLQPYHDAWYAEVGRELRFQVGLRNAFTNLSDKDLDWAWEILAKPENTAAINRMGDIDYPSRAALDMLRREPQLLRLVPKAVMGLLKAPS